MSRNVDIVGKLFPNKADKDLFDTLFYSDDGLPLLKIIRKKDSEDHIYFEFQVDGAENPYATEEDVDEKIAALGRVLTYKGKVATIDDLPASGNNHGDVWYVDEASAEYVWIVDDNIGSWEELGPVISDVPHAKKADLADYADNLTPYSEDSGVTQSVPFINQGTGCANGTAQADTGSFMQLKEKRGNAVVVNQLIGSPRSVEAYGVTATYDSTTKKWHIIGTATSTNYSILITGNIYFYQGHNYLLKTTITGTKGSGYVGAYVANQINLQDTTQNGVIGSPTASGTAMLWFRVVEGETYDCYVTAFVSDLTQWFGSTDNIPSDLLSHPENFFRYYQGDLSYNAGTLVNSNARYLTNIGRNLWDEEWELGSFDASGNPIESNNNIRTENNILVTPGETYYFRKASGKYPNGFKIYYLDIDGNVISTEGIYGNNTFEVPANCVAIKWFTYSTVTTYDHDITISRYYEGESGYDQHYQHEVLAVVDTGTESLYSAGSAYDSKVPSGLITRRIGSVDLSARNWTYANNRYRTPIPSDMKYVAPTKTPNFICASKIAMKADLSLNDYHDGICLYRIGGVNQLIVYAESDSTPTPTGILYYELTEPTTEQGTPFVDQDGNPIGEFIPCDDFGSMIVSADNFNGIPMGNEIFYPVNYKAYLDTLVNHTSGDPTSIVRKSDMPSNKMYMYSLYFDTLSTDENEEISVYFNVISKDPNLFVSDSDTIVQENNFKTLCENYSGVYFTASGSVVFDDTGENKTVSYVKVNKYPNTYNLSIRFNDGGYYNKTIINNQGAFVEFAGLLSCGVKVEI